VSLRGAQTGDEKSLRWPLRRVPHDGTVRGHHERRARPAKEPRMRNEFDFTRCTLETAKGRYRGTLREVCEKQASIQGAMASILIPFGKDYLVKVDVDDIEFDPDNIKFAMKTVQSFAVIEAEDMGLLS
jgi:hypothetical protein